MSGTSEQLGMRPRCYPTVRTAPDWHQGHIGLGMGGHRTSTTVTCEVETNCLQRYLHVHSYRGANLWRQVYPPAHTHTSSHCGHTWSGWRTVVAWVSRRFQSKHQCLEIPFRDREGGRNQLLYLSPAQCA